LGVIPRLIELLKDGQGPIDHGTDTSTALSGQSNSGGRDIRPKLPPFQRYQQQQQQQQQQLKPHRTGIDVFSAQVLLNLSLSTDNQKMIADNGLVPIIHLLRQREVRDAPST
jgi:hypothetical protein